MAIRVVLAAAAACAIAWFALGLHEARLLESAGAVAVGPARGLTPARTAAADRDLRDAADLLGHRDPTAVRARLLARTGHPARAVRLLESLVRDEPDNAIYWAVLARTASGVDPSLAARARLRLRRLDPRGTP